ncbi:MAG: peptidase domain-containing ABC transporter [Bacilli bacterium]|nr:peptidase domain-containing ABC transporter [Bacilli bacterium]
MKYPFVKQEGIKDCGVASLQMIIEYYHGYINMEHLRNMTKTTKDGTTAYHLINAANKIGFSAKGVKCEFDEIQIDKLLLPCIASVTLDNSYLHFIVIYEINYKQKYLVIGDPASKLKRVSFDYFKLVFNKVLIILKPTSPIPLQEKVDIYSFVFKTIRSHHVLLKQLLFLSLFITIFSIINSFYIQYMIDEINNHSKNNIFFIFYIFFSICILKLLTDYFRNKVLIYINQKLDITLMVDNFFKIIKLPYHYYKNRTTGEVVARFNDLSSIRDVISKFFLAVFIDMPLALIALIFMYFISHKLFLISLLMLGLYIIVILLFRHKYQDYINDVSIARSKVSSYMVESLEGFETIKGLHIENRINDSFEKKYVYLLKNLFHYHSFYFIIHLLKDAINHLGITFIVLLGSLYVIDNQMTIGELMTFNALLTIFLDPIRNIIDLDNSINEAKNALKRILELIVYKTTAGTIKHNIKGNIAFNDLTYTFDDSHNILTNINFSIEQGKKVAMIGRSGSGKSTLFKLLMKYYEVGMGKILVDGIDINNYQVQSLNSIIYIGQKEIIFTDSVYNNINLDNSDTSTFLNVCKSCYIDDIVKRSNLGYNMLLEENGANISGGERQRIILARSLLRRFSVLIIDEGTNQIDIDLERKILKNIFNLYKFKTIIFITHRLDNIDLFDQLIELKDGCIVRNEMKNGKL